MDNLLNQDATVIAAALAAKDVSAVDLMQATLDRIDAVNPQVNAIVSLRDRGALLDEAQAADNTSAKGPLHGIPMAVKDLANVAGLPTSQGSPLFAGKPAATSDLMVKRTQDAGAIIIGKTNTPEFGLGSHTYNPVFGATHNALMPGHSAGGSSGGAAVALAKGMVSLADGSDMMGSLRNPAGWNGVYGMRPTWGRVPSEPAGDLFQHTLSTNGPMARSPRDIALLLAVQQGPDPRRPFGYVDDGQVPAPHGKRIGWLGDWGGAYPMQDGVLDHCATALGKLQQEGYTIADTPPPFSAAALWEAWTTLRSWAVAAGLGPLYDQPKMRAQLKPEAIWEIERGRALTGLQLQKASNIRSDWFRAAAKLFETVDFLVLPTAQCWPFPVTWDWPKSIGTVTMDTYHRWMEIVIPVSLIGLPALAVPVAGSRPIGLQIIGRHGSDNAILELGGVWHGIN